MNREIKFRAWDKEAMQWATPGSLAIEPDFTLTGIGGDIVLMQFTGLKDKNGKEIYEGDIAQGNFRSAFGSDMTHTATVTWCDERNGWELRTGATDEDHWDLNGVMEIIGNIYENPDLLS